MMHRIKIHSRQIFYIENGKFNFQHIYKITKQHNCVKFSKVTVKQIITFYELSLCCINLNNIYVII